MRETTGSSRDAESTTSRREPSRSAQAEETEQLVVTIAAATGEVVKIEKIDKAGKRGDLSEGDCLKLAGEDEVEEIEAALEEAFEAGIAGALREEDETDDDEVDEVDEVEGTRLVISGLLARGPVLGRLRRRTLQRLLLRRLLRRRLLQRRFGPNQKADHNGHKAHHNGTARRR